MTSVAFAYLSPIKSLSFQSAQTLIIKKDIGIEEDRIFAFSRGLNEVDAKRIEKEPSDRELIHFLTLNKKHSFSNNPVLLSFLITYVTDSFLASLIILYNEKNYCCILYFVC